MVSEQVDRQIKRVMGREAKKTKKKRVLVITDVTGRIRIQAPRSLGPLA